MVSDRTRQGDRWLKPSEAGKILNCSGETVKNWMKNGKIQGVQLPSGRWLLRESDVLALLEPAGKR
jgi:excisionase family DNA binding protein